MESVAGAANTATNSTILHSRWRRWRNVFLVTGSLIVAVYLAHPMLLRAAGLWLNDGEQLSAPVDCILVLGGGADTRPFQAAAIYRAGYAKRVLISRFNTVHEKGERSETDILRDVLHLRSVPDSAIVELNDVSVSTRGEIAALNRYITENAISSVAIVTNDFHTRRARLLARRQLSLGRDQLHVVAVPTDGYGPDNWWRSPAGTNMYLLEYAKLFRDFWR